MLLLKRSSKIRVTPWVSSAEWESVRLSVFSEKPEEIEFGLARLKIWIRRRPDGVSPLSSTIYFLKAKLIDEKYSKGLQSIDEVISAYKEAINMFVQNVLDKPSKRQDTNNKVLAESLDIPTWIIDVRNDAIHHFRSSLPLLRETSAVLLKWLQENCWDELSKEVIQESMRKKRDRQQACELCLIEYLEKSSSKKRSFVETNNSFDLLVRELFDLKPEDIVDVLVNLEALSSLDVSISIPLQLRRIWVPIFVAVGDKITDLFVRILETYQYVNVSMTDRENVDKPMRVLLLWIKTLLSDNLTYDGRTVQPIDYRRIVEAAIKVVSSSTSEILDYAIPNTFDPAYTSDEVDLIRRVYLIYSGERAKESSPDSDNARMYTVEDVLKEKMRRHSGSKSASGEPTAKYWGHVDPSTIPLGRAPNGKDLLSDMEIDVGDYVPFDEETEEEFVNKEVAKVLRENQEEKTRGFDKKLHQDRLKLRKNKPLWKFRNRSMVE